MNANAIGEKFRDVAIDHVLATSLKDRSEDDIGYVRETYELLDVLCKLDRGIVERPPYHDINLARVSRDAIRRLLEFNAIYQVATKLSGLEGIFKDAKITRSTKLQEEMPAKYVAACGFADLIRRYQTVSRTSAKEGFNRRIIGGFFAKPIGGYIPETLNKKLKELNLQGEAEKHFDDFVEVTRCAVNANNFGAWMGALASIDNPNMHL